MHAPPSPPGAPRSVPRLLAALRHGVKRLLNPLAWRRERLLRAQDAMTASLATLQTLEADTQDLGERISRHKAELQESIRGLERLRADARGTGPCPDLVAEIEALLATNRSTLASAETMENTLDDVERNSRHTKTRALGVLAEVDETLRWMG